MCPMLYLWCGVCQYWTDERLSWNESDYGNVSLVSVSGELLWLPDVAVFNA